MGITNRWLQVPLICVVALSCGHDTTGPVRAGIVVLSGAGVTDTIEARLPQPLVVQIHDSSGQRRPGATVIFSAVVLASDSLARIKVDTAAAGYGGARIAVVADRSADAAVHVQFGTVAEPQRIAIYVPDFGLSDTVSYTVTPGAQAGVTAAPADTSIIRSHSYALRGMAIDRAGNPRTDPVAYAAGTSDITVSANGTINGLQYARTFITVTSASFVDTARLSVVPAGQLAAFKYIASTGETTAVAVFNTDGSNYREYFGATTYWNHVGPEWAPSGNRLVFENGGSGLANSRLMTLDVSATGFSNLLQVMPGDTLASELYPQYSHDGTWIYFTGAEAFAYGMTEVWRVHPDGTGAVRVGLPATEYYGESQASPSPDGTRIVYAATVNNGVVLRILTLSAGTSVVLTGTDGAWRGPSPRWSPNGDWIGYIDNGQVLAVIHPDGSGYRVVSSAGQSYQENIDWSPDEQWIVAEQRANLGASVLQIINVQSGLTLPLAFSGPLRLSDPSWHP